MEQKEDQLNSQAFWNEFMRRPEAKEAYQADKRLEDKKNQWQADARDIQERSRQRQVLASALEDAPAELKKLVAPMFHIRVVEQFMWIVYEECQKNKANFHDRLREERTISHLTRLRENFQDGGEDRMEDVEKQWHSMCNQIAVDEDAKTEHKPISIDVHTLKHVLEFGQECKREGNLKFSEGLYEEALAIYTQGDEVMKKWKVEKHMKNEHKWLKDYHLACLKNKAQAALKLDLFQTAFEAAEAALALDPEDHKAWYRRVLALKGLGKFSEAEETLNKLEEVAHWCPERRNILRDCEAERKRIRWAAAKHKQGTQEMLTKAFEAGIFSGEREKELEVPNGLTQTSEEPPRRLDPLKPLERKISLTAALAGDLVDELAEAYSARQYQEQVQKCARDSGYEQGIFMRRLKGIAFEVQKPILVKWGFEGSEHGVREMQAAIRDHVGRKQGEEMPPWLKAKQDKCLEVLYGGKKAGMLQAILG